MKKSEYKITRQEFERISKLADNVLNIIIVVDYFIENQPDEESLYPLAPIIKNLRHHADLLNTFFIDKEN